MTIRSRLLAGFVAIAALSIAAQLLSLGLVLRSQSLLRESNLQIGAYGQKISQAQSVILAVDAEIMATLTRTKGVGEAPRLDQETLRFYRLITEMDALFPERNAAHQEFQVAFMAYYVFAKRLLQSAELGTLDEHPEQLEQFRKRQVLLYSKLGDAQNGLREALAVELAEMERDADRMTLALAAVSLAVLGLSLLGALVLSKRFAAPMSRLLKAVETTQEGDSIGAQEFSSDEVGKLAAAFSEMKRRLAQRERELLLSRNLETMGRLAGGIAHEFNNLLGSISTALHRLMKESPESSRKDIENLAALCRRGGDLGAQLLALASNRPERQDVIDPAHFTTQFEEIIRRIIPPGVRCSVTLAGPIPPIHCSAALLHSSLLNLALNALDAMPQGGDLSIGCFPEIASGGESRVVFQISDTGHGIKPEDVPRIFDPFFSTKPVGKGAGLGLSIVESFTRRSGGDVSVRSDRTGTTFSLRLPVQARPGEESPAVAVAQPPGRRIALLTDQPSRAENLPPLSREAGVTLFRPQPGKDLLDMVKELSPPLDLILIDAGMTEVPPHHLYPVLRRFFPQASILFFGRNRGDGWMEGESVQWLEEGEAPLDAPDPERMN